MAIYRIFPEKDTFIFSEPSTGNAGRDEVLEIGGFPGINQESGQASRILTKFSDTEISDVLINKIGELDYSASINMYLADASEIPVEYTVYAYPVFTGDTGEWDNGTGKLGDIPLNTSGVSWVNKKKSLQEPWIVADFPSSVTGSFPDTSQGGGNWYIQIGQESMEFSQTHTANSTHDLSINVTPAIKKIYEEELINRGFLIKLQDNYEFSTDSSIRLKYFGRDTNTIYPPFLEFGWDDSIFTTGSLPLLDTSQPIINIKNNKGKYPDTGKQRFRITARPQYPPRTFSTSSIYLENYALPEESYWGLRDENTEEMVVDFNPDFTKISCDIEGPFFDVYMDGLQPERYYRILVKTKLDTSTTVVDNRNIFKVVRNG